jgi:uncharacterized protein (DUF433 family)
MDANTNSYVEIRKNRDDQDRPYVAGTRVRVQDIVIDHERYGQSAEEIARQLPHLSIAQVHGALAYFFEDREAIWQCIRDDEAFVDKMRLEQASATVPQGLISPDAGNPAVSS